MVIRALVDENILAENVDAETFMREYAELHAEWINGTVIKMSPVTETHHWITMFLKTLLAYYLEKTGEGEMRAEPFVMQVSETRKREPDIFVVTTANLSFLKPTLMEKAADLVIEVVSADSIKRDRGEKFEEYEAAGVQEYWIVDPLREENLFYTRSEDGVFRRRDTDTMGIYTSRVLPHLKFMPSILFKYPIPGVGQAVQLVNEMLGES